MNLSDAAIGRLKAAAASPGPLGERYDLLDELGRGGMGVVYRALDRELDREVAVKVPCDNAVVQLEPRLRAEARVLAALEHPGIVPIHDIGRLADGRAFYVMKLVRGRTLRDHLADLGDITDRLRIFERICDPVAFAHAHGCIHRDLKPENVMIGEFGEVMVMDWGVARRAASTPRPGSTTTVAPGTQSGLVVGTHGFMAPEQAAAQQIDHRADVYSLGALLVLLLTGRSIDDADPAADIRRQSDVPRALRSICAKALQASPGARYQSVEALAADVARFRAGLAVEAHQETLAERLTRFGRTYRAAILLVLAYIVMRVLVAALAGW